MRKVEVTTQIRTSSDQIIKAFIDPEMLRDWWGVQSSLIETRAGGPYTLAWDITENGFGYVSSGVIKSFIPEAELIIENFIYLNPNKPILGFMSLTIKARSIDQHLSEITLCQDGYQSGAGWDWYYEAVKEAWPMMVEKLKEYLESRH